MAGHVEQRPWTPTVRIGKIAAETTNPGPAIVQLPTLIGKWEAEFDREISLFHFSFPLTGSKVPDSKKKGAPSYTFGHKIKSTDETTGPGPAQYNVSGMRPKGKDHSRCATLQSRPKDLTVFVNPGPGEYDVNTASKAAMDATPKYTFGKRPPPDKYQLIPGKLRLLHSDFLGWFYWRCLNGWSWIRIGIGIGIGIWILESDSMYINI